MQNRTLKRQFKKYLGVKNPEELDVILSWVSENLPGAEVPLNVSKFLKDFTVFVQHIDKVLDDNVEKIELKERSLIVSTKELTEAQETLEKKSQQQARVLEKLQSVVERMDTGSLPVSDMDTVEVNDLVLLVEALVDAQAENSKTMEKLFKAGQALSSCQTLMALEKQVFRTFMQVSGVNLISRCYFRSDLFGMTEEPVFYPLKTDGSCDCEASLKKNDGYNYIFIDSAKGEGTLAVIELEVTKDSDVQLLDCKMASIRTLSSLVANCIENIRFLIEEKKKQYLQNELETARLVQKTLLPPPRIVAANQLEIGGYYQSASECGGDWWNYFTIGDNKTLVFVGDVTGHGTASAMLSAVVRGYCDSFLYRSDFDIKLLLRELNRVVYKTSRGTNRLMTMSAALIDTAKNHVVFSNAGHNLPILIQPQAEKKIRYMNVSGPTLGLRSNPEFCNRTYDFFPGDTLLMYTDGIVECLDTEDEYYGESRLRRLVRDLPTESSADGVLASIRQDVDKFRKGAPLNDDVTLVAVNFSKIAQQAAV